MLGNMRRLLCFSLLLCSLFVPLWGQSPYDEVGWLPDKGEGLVCDLAGTLSSEQRDALEARLEAFDDSTSNQIVILLTPGLGGNDVSQFAFDVGNKWGIGQRELRNGVLIVIKPKDETAGQVEIATGEGLEGALPDVFCKRIIEDEMIPHFREDDYYGGIVAALDVILPVCAGEYSYEQYRERHNDHPLATLLITLAVIVIILVVVHRMGGGDGSSWTSGSGGTFYGGGPVNSWGGWSGGSSWSGGGGGFGGFGGGSFGGGGASGRW